MGYRIIYAEEKKQEGKGRRFRILVMSVGFFILFLQILPHLWPEGMELMQNLLPMRQAQQTFRAAEVFSQELASGFSLWDAADNFWNTLLEYGHSH